MRFDNIYKGIVIQNNDPEYAGRVKVYVPSISPNLFDGWNEDKEDKQFIHLGKNTNTDITPELLFELKTRLPWARVEQPVFGMGTVGFFENNTHTTYIGNDSTLKSQEANKQENFFKEDENRSSQPRLPKSENTKSPNETTDTKNGISQEPSFFPLPKCSDDDLKNKKNKSNALNCENDLIDNLPDIINNSPNNIFNNSPNNIFFDSDIPRTPRSAQIRQMKNNKNINDSIADITVEAVNPQNIKINNISTPFERTIFNNDCFEDDIGYVPSENFAYNVPITFQATSNKTNSNFNNIPINFIINGVELTDITNDEIRIDENNIHINHDGIEFDIPTNNLRSIKIGENANGNAFKNIKSIPLLNNLNNTNKNKSAFKNIFPRVPSLKPMNSTGGGAGSAYNRANTTLLPEEQRRESLIGGNNPVSKENRNYTAEDKEENSYHFGNNQQSIVDASGPYRPPDHANHFKGFLSIPSPGAHVDVRFENGDPNYPIVVGICTSQGDYKGIFEVE